MARQQALERPGGQAPGNVPTELAPARLCATMCRMPAPYPHGRASAQARLAAHLRQEAARTRSGMPEPSSAPQHCIDVEAMEAYAELCERVDLRVEQDGG